MFQKKHDNQNFNEKLKLSTLLPEAGISGRDSS